MDCALHPAEVNLVPAERAVHSQTHTAEAPLTKFSADSSCTSPSHSVPISMRLRGTSTSDLAIAFFPAGSPYQLGSRPQELCVTSQCATNAAVCQTHVRNSLAQLQDPHLARMRARGCCTKCAVRVPTVGADEACSWTLPCTSRRGPDTFWPGSI